MGEWALLAEWQASPVSLVGVDLAVLRGRLRLVGRARASLAAFEADLVGEITRQEGEARKRRRSCAATRSARWPAPAKRSRSRRNWNGCPAWPRNSPRAPSPPRLRA